MKSHVDSQSPGNPNGIDAYVHFFYNQAWQELESRVSTSENTGPESLQPELPVRLVAAVHRRARAAGQEHGCRRAVRR